MNCSLLMTLPYTGEGKIFETDELLKYVAPFIDATDPKFYFSYFNGWYKPRTPADPYGIDNVNKFNKYLTKTQGQFYVQMLKLIENQPCSYHEIYHALLEPKGKPFGNDAASFKGLEENGLVKLHHLGKWKRRFFELSDLGKLVLDAARKNHVVYRVLRHFMKLDGEEIPTEKLINISLDHETMLDLEPETFVEMLDAILNNNSDLHKLGTYAYWCQKLIACLKNDSFFDMFVCPQVLDYLKEHGNKPNVQRFTKVLNRLTKSRAKHTA